MSTAVLLMAYGAAATLDDIPAYLADIRGGRPADDGLVAEVRERYRLMGGGSPLLDITRLQAGALEARLGADASGGHKVYVGMRHSPPSIREAVAAIRRDGHDAVVAVPLTPFGSRMTVGAYLAKLAEAAAEERAAFRVLPAASWHDDPLLVRAWAGRLREALGRLPPGIRDSAAVLCTGHSLPESILKDHDPYPGQLRGLSRLVAEAAGAGAWEFAFQSQGRTGEPWLGPDAGEVLTRLAAEGRKAAVLVPVGFLSDHMETLYDVDVLYRRRAESLGLAFSRADSLNAHPLLIEALAGVVRRAAAAGRGAAPGIA